MSRVGLRVNNSSSEIFYLGSWGSYWWTLDTFCVIQTLHGAKSNCCDYLVYFSSQCVTFEEYFVRPVISLPCTHFVFTCTSEATVDSTQALFLAFSSKQSPITSVEKLQEVVCKTEKSQTKTVKCGVTCFNMLHQK